MRRARRALQRWACAITGLLATLALVGLPVEVTIRFVEHPVVAPTPVVSLLIVASCLLLIGSGLGLRRLEIAPSGAQPPTPDV